VRGAKIHGKAGVCESLKRNKDLLLKNRGSYIDIIEMQRKVKEKESRLLTANLSLT